MNIEYIPSQISQANNSKIVFLPGGLSVDGRYCRDVEIRELTSGDASQILNAEGSQKIITILKRSIVRIGSSKDITEKLLWNLFVADRDYLLLKILELNFGNKILASIYCANPKCGKPMDIDFFLDQIPVRQQYVEDDVFTVMSPDKKQSGTKKIDFHLIRWNDIEDFLESGSSDIEPLVRKIVKSVDGNQTKNPDDVLLSHEDIIAIQQKIQQVSPVVDLEMFLQCPECDKQFSIPFQPSKILLNQLDKDGNNVLIDIHTIAYYYHWSEREIMALPISRKQKYLSLIRQESFAKSDFQ